MIKEYTLTELATAASMNYEQCRYHLRELGIKPMRVIGRNNLYDEQALEQLRQV